MSFRLILFIIIQLAALIFFIETLRRVAKRANEYHLTESRPTLPFGFVRLRYAVILYIISYIVWLTFSIVLYLVLIDPTSSYYLGTEGTERIESLELNL